MTNLKRIIDEKGVQQRWLAEQVGVTEVSMSRYVNGERIPKAPMAIRMADVLGVDVKELYGRDDKHVVGEPEQPETHSVCLDTISRQAAIDALDRIFDRCEEIEAHLPEGDPDRTGYKMYPDYMTVWKYLHQLPSAQPEIIRCTECKHYREYDSEYVENAVVVQCMADRYPISETIPDGWFCAGAERRTDEQ